MITKKYIREVLNQRLMNDNDEKQVIGGVLLKCETTDRVFLLLRNDTTPIWSLMSGGIDEGENIIDGIKREIYEELFIKTNDITFKKINIEHIPNKNREFHYFEGFTNREFKPILDHENLNYGWFSKDNLPSPLYKGLAEKIANIYE
jgi:8-oxo-dGTP pyrophosphatase MutT (NUDIX family)